MSTENSKYDILDYMLKNMYYEHPEETALVAGRDIFYIVESNDYKLVYSCEHENYKHIRHDYTNENVTCYKKLYGLDAPCKGCSIYDTEKGAVASWITSNEDGNALRLIRSHVTIENGISCYNNVSTSMNDMDEVFRHMQRINASRELVLRSMNAFTDTSLSPAGIFEEILRLLAEFYGATSCILAFHSDVPTIYSYYQDASQKITDYDAICGDHFYYLKNRMKPHSVCFVDKLDNIKSAFPDITEKELDYNADRLLLAPIHHNDGMLGVIALNDVKLNKRDIPTFCSLTDMIGVILSDISSKEIQKKLSSTDSLTGIYNYEGFKERAEELLADSQNKQFAMVSVDIRDFKNINDFFGYETGDDLLKYWVEFEQANKPEEAILCRMQADTFCFLVPITNGEVEIQGHFLASVEALKGYVADYISETYVIELVAGCYFIEESDMLTLNEMFNRTNMARTHAKNSPGSVLNFYDKNLHETTRFEKEIENRFAESVATNQVVPFFQPQMCLSAKAKEAKRVRAEALARWINPDGSVYARPDQFIPVLERTGHISKLDHYIYRNVCKTIRELRRKGIATRISVNVSRSTMFKPGFAEYYEAIRQEYILNISLSFQYIFLSPNVLI